MKYGTVMLGPLLYGDCWELFGLFSLMTESFCSDPKFRPWRDLIDSAESEWFKSLKVGWEMMPIRGFQCDNRYWTLPCLSELNFGLLAQAKIVDPVGAGKDIWILKLQSHKTNDVELSGWILILNRNHDQVFLFYSERCRPFRLAPPQVRSNKPLSRTYTRR